MLVYFVRAIHALGGSSSRDGKLTVIRGQGLDHKIGIVDNSPILAHL